MSPSEPTEESVVLIRFTAGPILRDPMFRIFGSGALLLVACVVFESLRTAPIFLLGGTFTAFGIGALAWTRAPVLLTLERRSGARVLTLERPGWFGRFRQRSWTTDESIALHTEKPSGNLYARFPTLLEASLKIGDVVYAPIYSTTEEHEEERFRAALAGFGARASRVPGVGESSARAHAALRELEKQKHDEARRLAPEFECAVEGDDAAAVAALLARGLDLWTSRIGDERPLDFAAQCGAPRVVELLLERGARPSSRALALVAWNAPENDGDDREAFDRHLAVARMLIARGAPVDGDTEGAGTVRQAFEEGGDEFQKLAR